jgi:hypothetical protein
VPYWDSAALQTHRLGNFAARPADPFNDHEPVDSSAAAIAAQGFIRLGLWLQGNGEKAAGTRYLQAGLTVASTLFDEPYLSTDPKHQGLLLHSVYHRPNGWDHVPKGRKVPCGESSMWGDYHAMELALLIQRLAAGKYHVLLSTIAYAILAMRPRRSVANVPLNVQSIGLAEAPLGRAFLRETHHVRSAPTMNRTHTPALQTRHRNAGGICRNGGGAWTERDHFHLSLSRCPTDTRLQFRMAPEAVRRVRRSD